VLCAGDHSVAKFGVGHQLRVAGHVELVVALTWESVHREALIARQIMPLGRPGRHGDEHSVFGKDRAEWMDSRRAVPTHGGDVADRDPVQ
jgi:hypothetical protein